MPDRSKNGKRKSSIHKSQLNPKFDEKFTFGSLQLSDFDDKILWLSVWHKDRLGRNEFLGEVLIPLSQIRHQLLTSDFCQSTSPKWYQLRERVSNIWTFKPILVSLSLYLSLLDCVSQVIEFNLDSTTSG